MIRLENVLKIFLQDLLKTSSKRLEDVLKIYWKRFCKTSWRRHENVLKTSWQERRLEGILKMSWRSLKDIWPRRIYWSWPRRLEDVLKTSSEDVRLRRTYSSWSRRLKDVFKTSSSRRMFAGHMLNRSFNYATYVKKNQCIGFIFLLGEKCNDIIDTKYNLL